MPKNIVVLSDGTGQEGGKGVGRNTNIYKLFTMLEDRTPRQVVFYDPGLGTGWRKVTGTIAGAGISRNVLEAYRFIFDHYEAHDRIFLVGFSRGATTVRSLAGFIDRFGILPRSRPNLIKQAYRIYKTRAPFWPPLWPWTRWARWRISRYPYPRWRIRRRTDRRPGWRWKDRPTWDLRDRKDLAEAVLAPGQEADEEFAKRFLDLHCPDRKEGWPEHPERFMRAFRLERRAREFIAANYNYYADVQFVGCFDTVAALYRIPLLQYQFHDLGLSKRVKNAYHALAIDEERRPFEPKLWEEPKQEIPGQVVRQVWFAGVHSDVGGGYPKRGLGEISLEWMLLKAVDCGMLLDPGNATLRPDPTATLHDSRHTLAKKMLYPRHRPRLRAPEEREQLCVEYAPYKWLATPGTPAVPQQKSVGSLPPLVLHQSVLDRASEDDDYRDKITSILGCQLDHPNVEKHVEPWERFLLYPSNAGNAKKLSEEYRLLSRQEDRWREYLAGLTRGSLLSLREWRQRKGGNHDSEPATKYFAVTSLPAVRSSDPVALATTPDRVRFVQGFDDGKVRRLEFTPEEWWDPDRETLESLRAGERRVTAVAFTSRDIISVLVDDTIEVWPDPCAWEERPEPRHTFSFPDGHHWKWAFTPEGSHAVSVHRGELRVWNLLGEPKAAGCRLVHVEEELHILPFDEVDIDEVAVAATPDGTRVAAVGEILSNQSLVRMWDLESGKELLSVYSDIGRFSSLAIAPDGRRIVAGSCNDAVAVWDAQTGSEFPKLRRGRIGPVTAMAVSPDGNRVISGYGDGTLKAWDLHTGSELETLHGHSDEVLAIAVAGVGDSAAVFSVAVELSLLDELRATQRPTSSTKGTNEKSRFDQRW